MRTIQKIKLPAIGRAEFVLKVMEKTKNKAAATPEIREAAIAIVRNGGGIANNAVGEQLNRLIAFAKQAIIYVRDPYGFEYIQTPQRILKDIETYGYAMGDCDDHALFLCTMGSAIGIKSRLVAVKLNGSAGWNHVISSFYLDDNWINVDACSKSKATAHYKEQLWTS